jgi:hypothetical protein
MPISKLPVKARLELGCLVALLLLSLLASWHLWHSRDRRIAFAPLILYSALMGLYSNWKRNSHP